MLYINGVGNKQKRTHADIVTKLSGWSEISEEEEEEKKEQEGAFVLVFELENKHRIQFQMGESERLCERVLHAHHRIYILYI